MRLCTVIWFVSLAFSRCIFISVSTNGCFSHGTQEPQPHQSHPTHRTPQEVIPLSHIPFPMSSHLLSTTTLPPSQSFMAHLHVAPGASHPRLLSLIRASPTISSASLVNIIPLTSSLRQILPLPSSRPFCLSRKYLQPSHPIACTPPHNPCL